MNKWKWFGYALILLIGTMLSGCQSLGGGFMYSGFIEGTEIPVQSERAGTVDALLAIEGQSVNAGDRLAHLDDAEANLQVDEAQAALDAAQAKWEEAKAGSRSEEMVQAEAQWEQARQFTSQTQARMKSAANQIEQLKTVKEQFGHDLQSMHETLRYHEKRLDYTLNLYDNGQATQDQVDSLREVVNQANMQVNDLQTKVKATEVQITQAEHELEAAKAQVEQATAAEKAAEARLSLVRAGSTDYQLRHLLALKDQAESRLAQAKLMVSKTVIPAPENGVILRKHVEKGEVIKSSSTLYTLLKTGEMKIVVYVPEAQLKGITIGSAADISVDTYPGMRFNGKVSRIAEKAEFTPKNVQTSDERTKMVFAVTIQVLGGFEQLKPGMPADVRFRPNKEGGAAAQ